MKKSVSFDYRTHVPASEPYYKAAIDIIKEKANKLGIDVDFNTRNLGYTCFSYTMRSTVAFSGSIEKVETISKDFYSMLKEKPEELLNRAIVVGKKLYKNKGNIKFLEEIDPEDVQLNNIVLFY